MSPIKNKDENRAYQKEWQRRKRLGLPTSGIKPRKKKRSLDDKRCYDQEYHRRRRAELNRRRGEVWGSVCTVCSSDTRLHLHRIDGKKHASNLTNLRLALEEPDEWVRLCYGCHKGVHWATQWLRLTWKEIKATIGSFK